MRLKKNCMTKSNSLIEFLFRLCKYEKLLQVNEQSFENCKHNILSVNEIKRNYNFTFYMLFHLNDVCYSNI